VTFYGPDSRKRQGQLYLWFAAVSKAQTLTAGTSASPNDTRPGSLPTTGLLNLKLEAESFDRYLSACGKVEFSTQSELRLIMHVKCIYRFFRLFSNTLCIISVHW